MNQPNPVSRRFLNVLAVLLNILTAAAFLLIILAIVIALMSIEHINASNWYYIFLHPGLVLALPTLAVVFLVNYLVFGRVGVWCKIQRAIRLDSAA